jgi:phosphotransacetylase
MIEALEQLIDKYHHLGIIKAQELLLHPEDAVSLANELEKKKILILGVDLWYYIDNKIVEDPSSLDLSEIKNAKTSARLVKEFITNQLPERTAFVSFVLEEDRIFEGTESEIRSNLH